MWKEQSEENLTCTRLCVLCTGASPPASSAGSLWSQDQESGEDSRVHPVFERPCSITELLTQPPWEWDQWLASGCNYQFEQ